MDQNLNAASGHNVRLGLNTTRMLFTFGNLTAIAIDALADLSDGLKLALSVAVVILNISCVLSFDTELKIFVSLSKDTGDENSAYANGDKKRHTVSCGKNHGKEISGRSCIIKTPFN